MISWELELVLPCTPFLSALAKEYLLWAAATKTSMVIKQCLSEDAFLASAVKECMSVRATSSPSGSLILNCRQQWESFPLCHCLGQQQVALLFLGSISRSLTKNLWSTTAKFSGLGFLFVCFAFLLFWS